MSDTVSTQQVPIIPGPCPPQGCPPATRIECILVDKVYDSCFQVEERSRSTEISTFSPAPSKGDVIPCTLTAGDNIACDLISKTAVGEGFFTLNLLFTVPLTLTNPKDPNDTVDRQFTFTKTVTLCSPDGTEVDCSESVLLFCSCVVTDVNNVYSTDSPSSPPTRCTLTVECDFQVCLVIKSIATVQLLVPSYGFCVPAPCITLPGVCPPAPPAQCTG